jgi:hypothetical protein
MSREEVERRMTIYSEDNDPRLEPGFIRPKFSSIKSKLKQRSAVLSVGAGASDPPPAPAPTHTRLGSP